MPATGGSNLAHRVLTVVVALVAILASAGIGRNAAVADRSPRSGLAETLWPGHPAVLRDRALLAIAGAASRGRPAPEGAIADMRRIAVRAPLSPDPYLVFAAIAETEGRAEAEPLLLAARSRDPRSRGTRYLLAEHYFRSGRIEAGLIETAALIAVQGGGQYVVPALAAYARSPGAVPKLRSFFARKPALESAVLLVLAGDAANADLLLTLASNFREPDPDWRPALVASLVGAGQFEKAFAVWARVSGIRPQRGLFNPRFEASPAPPPFNWTLAEGGEGLAEPDGKGGLSLLYYGRANALLASQLLLLPPGPYRLAMSVERASGEEGALRWTLRCASAGQPFAVLPLRTGPVAGDVLVPPGCTAQWLELQGAAGDVPQTSELIVRGLRLEPARMR